MDKSIKKKVDQELLGYHEYIRHPEYANIFGGPFNGQKFRQELFLEIIDKIKIDLIIETGTFRGSTAHFMSKHSSSIILSVESNKKFYGYSKLRFLLNNQIKLILDDSRKFLNEFLSNPKLRSKNIFFYLDAHWENDLPLIEELNIIFNKCDNPIIMIDDFQVPFDDGYAHDDYGFGKTLSLELFNQLEYVKTYKFFPSQSSEKETGLKRGCIVLTQSDEVNNNLLKLDSLKFFE